MRKCLAVFAALCFAWAEPATANEPCPPHPAGSVPWFVDGLMNGDRYADIYLDIDEHGRPTACRFGQNNILGDDKFWICRAFMEQWSTKPAPHAGAAGRVTVKRQYVEYGPKHQEAEKAARRKYFLEHPTERSECYRDN